MDILTSMVSAAPSKLLLILLSPLHLPSSPSATTTCASIDKNRSHLLCLFRDCLLLALHAFLFLIRVASLSLTRAFPYNPIQLNHGPRKPLSTPPEEEGTYVSRALSRVLAAVTRTPVSSRKYELVRTLADRLLDDNVACGAPALADVNHAALAAALTRTLRRLEAAAALRERESGGKTDWSVERLLGGVRTRLGRWADLAEEDPDEGACGGGGGEAAEKLASEVMWLTEKMAACGAAGSAAARWGSAAGLARLALAAEPRLQGAFVKISAFLFKHANSKELKGDNAMEQGTVAATACHQDMLTSWLPVLCRASNGMDSPVLSRLERAEMEGVLEKIIEKLSWEEQEEVLSLWLYHFTACPDSDWPNLQPCYTRWYAISRNLLVK